MFTPMVLAGLLRLLGVVALATAFLLVLQRTRPDLVRFLALSGGAGLVVGSGYGLGVLVATLSARLNRPFLPLLLEYATHTRVGQLTLVQMAAGVLVTGMLLLLLRMQGRVRQQLTAFVSILCAGILFLVPWAMAAMGHAGSTVSPGMTIAIQSLHISSGLVWCALVGSVLAAGPHTVVQRLRTLGNWALAAVVLLVVTGIWAAWLHQLRPENLTRFDYGLWVLLKAALLAGALVAAGLNRWAIRRELAFRRVGTGPVWRTVVAESVLLGLILVAAGALARSMPPH